MWRYKQGTHHYIRAARLIHNRRAESIMLITEAREALRNGARA
jgi:hypothetical protein